MAEVGEEREHNGSWYRWDGSSWAAFNPDVAPASQERPYRDDGGEPGLGTTRTHPRTGERYSWNGVAWISEHAPEGVADQAFAEHRDQRARENARERYAARMNEMNPFARAGGAFSVGAVQGASLDFADEAVESSGALPYADEAFGAAWNSAPIAYGSGYLLGAVRGAPAWVYNRIAGATGRGINAVAGRAASQMGDRGLRTYLLARQAGQGLVAGASTGALGGAGFDRDDRLRGARWGAAIGGPLGAAGPVVGHYAAPVLERWGPTRAASRWLGLSRPDDGSMGRVMLAEAQALDDAAVQTGIRPPGVEAPEGLSGEIRRRTAAQMRAEARRTGVRRRPGPETDEELAARWRARMNDARLTTAQRMNADQGIVTPAGGGSVNQKLTAAAARRGAVPARNIDVAQRHGADNVLQLGEDMAGRAGQGRNWAAGVWRGAQRRLDELVETRVNEAVPSSGRVGRAEQDRILRGEQRRFAPIYEAADSTMIQTTDEVAGIIETPIGQRWLRMALREADNEGAGAQYREWLRTVDGEVPDASYRGPLRVADEAPTAFWSRITQNADAQIYSASANAATGRGTATRRAINVGRAHRATLEGNVQRYNTAHARMDAESAMLHQQREASRHAERFLRPGSAERGGHMDWMDTAHNGSPPGARERIPSFFNADGTRREHMFRAARQRAVDLLTDYARNDPRQLMRMLRNRDLRARLDFLFGNDDAARLVRSLEDQGTQLAANERLTDLTNSATARRLGEQSSGLVSQLIADAFTGGAPLHTGTGVIRQMVAQGRQISSRDADEIIRILLSDFTEQATKDALREGVEEMARWNLLGPFRGPLFAALNSSATRTLRPAAD